MSSKKGSSSLRYFSDDATGFKIQPKTVLIVSLVFIGLVVLLHIYSKISATNNEEKKPEAPQEPTAQSGETVYTEETL